MATGVKAEGGRFAIVPEWLILEADPQALRLYALLASKYANHDGEAHPSRRTLAESLGVSMKTIDRSIETLSQVGAIETVKRFTEQGDADSNGYYLRRSRPGVASPMSPQVATPVTPPVASPMSPKPELLEPEPLEPELPNGSGDAREGQSTLLPTAYDQAFGVMREIKAWPMSREKPTAERLARDEISPASAYKAALAVKSKYNPSKHRDLPATLCNWALIERDGEARRSPPKPPSGSLEEDPRFAYAFDMDALQREADRLNGVTG